MALSSKHPESEISTEDVQMKFYDTTCEDRSREPLYSTLPDCWFRLLLIHPAANIEDEIECTMQPYSPYSAPRYSALSYMWGELTDLCIITLNDRRIQVRPNLAAAIRRFRQKEGLFCIWIDALCINQDSISERNHQVAMMSKLYSEARETLVWIGDSSPEDIGALTFVPVLKSIIEQGTASNINSTNSWTSRHITRGLLALSRLTSRPYWTRVWIVQEIVLAQRVILHCGDESLDWDILEQCFSCPPHEFMIIFKTKVPELSSSQIEKAWRNIGGKLDELRVLRLTLQSSRYPKLQTLTKIIPRMEASDTRDKLFSLLSIAHPSHNLEVDYGKPLNEVFINATRSFIQQSGNLEEFWWLNGSDEALLNNEFPSWVPDPTIKSRSFRSLMSFCQDNALKGAPSYFSAAGSEQNYAKADIKFRGNGKILCVNGVFIDSIVEMDDAPSAEAIKDSFNKTRDFERALASWFAIATRRTSSLKLFGTSQILEIFWRIILTDHQPGSYGSEPTLPTDRLPTVLPPDSRIPPASEEDVQELISSLAFHQPYAFDRRFYITSKGFMGLAPRNACTGDLIYVLFGAEVPFVLRKYNYEGGFRVIGDCYTHGIMDGEAVTGAEEGKYRLERVELF